jgi:prepilin-type N-terminal cleavage/methylation domain-containing protein
VRSERDASTREGGFTLIEVLMAMVILAIGLLGLEALGIGAARAIALAERQSSYATLASDSLESALHQLRSNTIPTQFCDSDLPHGDRLSRLIDLSDPWLGRVVVQVIPNQESFNAPRQTFEITSSVYLPVALPGGPLGQPCS